MLARLLLAALLAGSAVFAAPARRLALVIGNDGYRLAPLANAVNDGKTVARALEDVGFRVTLSLDADLDAMQRAVQEFAASLRPGDVALFYFAGHGIQLEGENYLIPVDFRPSREEDAKTSALPASRVCAAMENSGARLNLLILDACRNNPYRRARSLEHSLAAMRFGKGTLIALSTGPGSTASDGEGAANGLFTGFLVEALREPELTLDEVFNRVKMKVRQATRDEQAPWVHSSVIGTFYFRPPRGWEPGEVSAMPPVAVPPPPPPPVRPPARQASPEARRLLAQALPKMEARDFGGAVSELERAVAAEPDFGEALLELGIARLQLGRTAAAREALEEAVRCLPASAEARLHRGVAYSELQQYEAAVADFTEAVRLDPHLAFAYWHRGLARSRLGDRAGAAEDFARFRTLRKGR